MIKNKAFIGKEPEASKVEWYKAMRQWREKAQIFYYRFHTLQTNQLLNESLQKTLYPNFPPFTPSALHTMLWC